MTAASVAAMQAEQALLPPESRPPAVTLSTPRVLKFRPFTLTLTMGRTVAQRFSEYEVMRAGLNAKCRKEDDLSHNVTACFCSAGKRVIEIGVSSKAVFGPRPSPDGALVTYTFDTCRSNCSSSRDHHKSRLMVVVDDLPSTRPVFSAPFVVQAREKQKRKKCGSDSAPSSPPQQRQKIKRYHSVDSRKPNIQRDDDDDDDEDPDAFPDDPIPGTGSGSGTCTAGGAAPTLSGMFAAGPASRQAGTALSASIDRAVAALAACPQPPTVTTNQSAPPPPPFAPAPSLASSSSSLSHLLSPPPPPFAVVATSGSGSGDPPPPPVTGLQVVVRVYSTTLTRTEADALVMQLEPHLRAIPGFRDYRWRTIAGFIVSFSFFDTQEGAESSVKVADSFTRNEIRNPYNSDLRDGHVWSLLCYCPSW